MPKEPSIYSALHYDNGCKELDDIIEETLARHRDEKSKTLARKTGRKETGHHWNKGD